MKRRFFISIFLLALFSIPKAQDDIKFFEKVEINANTNQKAWNEHIMSKTQLPDSILKNIPPGAYKVNVQLVIDKH